MNFKKIVSVFALMILVVSTISTTIILDSKRITDPPISQKNNAMTSDLTEHNPIAISNDYNLSISGFPGSGTEGNPYRIENYDIDGEIICISVHDTTLHIRISNCILRFTNPSTYSTYGIFLDNVTNCVINNCTVIDGRYGVMIEQSHNCTIEESTIDESDYGVIVYLSQYITLIGNRFTCWSTCVRLEYSEYIVLKFNSLVSHDSYSIDAYNADFCTIANNEISGNWASTYVVYLESTEGIIFSNNTISETSRLGIGLSYFNTGVFYNNSFGSGVILSDYAIVGPSVEFIDNIVRGKPFGYFRDVDSIQINANLFGQIILLSSINVSITNGNFNGVSQPIYMNSCFNCTVKNSNLNNSWWHSISLYSSDNCSVIDNTISYYNDVGIYARYSDYLLIQNNQISNGLNPNGESINILDSYFCTVALNEISSTLGVGIEIQWSSAAVENNIISCSYYQDLYLRYAYDCEITDNIMQVGVLIYSNYLEDWYHTFSGNLVSGRSIGYFTDVSSSIIENEEYHQIILVNATEVAVTDDINPTSLNSIILMECSHITLDDLTLESENYIDNRIQYCDNITMQGFSQVGQNHLYIQYSENIMISGSTFNQSYQNAIEVRNSNNISIRNCIIASNYVGISFYYVENSSITDSIILYNTYYGIDLSSHTQYCSVYGNKIGWNGYNAFDYGMNNNWDDGVNLGNWWHDYEGSGVYLIPGPAGSIDRYPRILEEYEPPVTTTTTPITTTYVDPYYTPNNPIVPTEEITAATEWYLQTILGIPIVTILGGLTGVLTLLGVVFVSKREK